MAPIIVRVRSSEGVERINLNDSDTLNKLEKLIEETTKVPVDKQILSLSGEVPVKDRLSGPAKTLKTLNINHGDMVYLTTGDNNRVADEPAAEELLDLRLAAQDGRVKQKKNPKFCKHADPGMCEYCMPLEPYDPRVCRHPTEANRFQIIHDEEERKGLEFKHLSFHTWLHQQREGLGRTMRDSFALDPALNLTVKRCNAHAPWPLGLCQRCKPPPITLEHQVYRHVDYLEFDNISILENFINYWRQTGQQRVGYMFGQYVEFGGAPLGIKAVVSAIYEPPQTGSEDGVELFDDVNEEKIDQVAHHLGLKRIGWVFTDIARDKQNRLLCTRTAESFFLTSSEVIKAAELQAKYPNYCGFSHTGTFGSKFMTCCITVSKEGGIEASAFQVSNMASALWENGVLLESEDITHCKVAVMKEGDHRYIPDIYFKKANKENKTVAELAAPFFPNDILLVQAAEGAALSADGAYFKHNDFPAAHRPLESDIQDQNKFSAMARKYSKEPFSRVLSDFNLLIYLACEFHALEMEDWKQIGQSIKNGGDVPLSEGHELLLKHAAGLL